MSELEKGRIDDEAKKTIDPCFSAYSIADKYVFSSVICTIQLFLMMVRAHNWYFDMSFQESSCSIH